MALRILLVGQALGGGGAETRFRLLARHLFDGEADVAVLVGTADAEHLHAIDLGWRGKLSYGRVVRRLRKLLSNRDYDAVMSFGMFPNIVSAIAIATMRRKPRLVFNEITRPLAQAATMGRMRGRVYRYLRRWFYPVCDLLTANSIDGLAEACALARIPVTSAIRTPNVMDLAEVHERANAETSVPYHPYFVCVNRLDFMKRVDTIVDAWQELGDATDARLLIVGDGEARNALEAQVARFKLQHKVRFVGSTKNPMPLLKHARGFILASEYEGFSNAVLEAMCLDVPVITSLCSSDARLMCEREAALGFEVDDARQLARHIRDLTGSNKLAGELVRNAAAYRAAHLVPDAILAYENLLGNCVAGREREFN